MLARGLFNNMAHSQFHTHMLRHRARAAVPVILGERIPRSDREEEEKLKWARMMLILFTPWRQPSDLKTTNETWLEAFERRRSIITVEHEKVIANMNVLSECRDVRDAHSAMRK
ncbi:hypothetical protein C8Q76DRAFT_610428, partial [Earliella scabrosa]